MQSTELSWLVFLVVFWQALLSILLVSGEVDRYGVVIVQVHKCTIEWILHVKLSKPLDYQYSVC